MALLHLELTNATWLAIVEYAQSRIDDMTEIAMATSTGADERLACVQRCDELRDLINAPKRAELLRDQRALRTNEKGY